MKHSRLVWLISCALLTGCTSLLPRGSTNTPPTFSTFEEAKATIESVIPFVTQASELRALGFDSERGQNVVVIPYPDVVGRLVPYAGVPLSELDPGIRQCILAATSCKAYLFRFEREDRRREGGFWSDFLNIRRETLVTGWWFEALIVVSGDTVLFRNHAGQRQTERIEKQANPLGPFQPAGEAAGSLLFH